MIIGATIRDGMVVGLSYSLKDAEGNEIDKSPLGEVFEYLHGVGQIVPGLEKALLGLKIGDAKDVIVSPAEGYGELVPELRMAVERSVFPKDQSVDIGMQFMAEMAPGQKVLFRVEAIEDGKVYVDGNHPLAGIELHFSVGVKAIRPATSDELEHGHAHGPDGHHHH